MENAIHPENLHSFAWSNGNLIKGKIRGIILDFHGLGGQTMPSTPSPLARKCAEKGLLYIQPYDNPWSWMNDMAVRYTDEIVDALIEKYSLPDNIPVVACGASMGGLSSLIYTRYAKRTPVACAANCPVCDLPYHYTERPDLPRTIYQAFMHYACDLQTALESASPLHQAAKLPDIPYLIVHGEADSDVDKKVHSDKFVAELRKTHDAVTYVEVPGMEHCRLQGDALEQYENFITSEAWFA